MNLKLIEERDNKLLNRREFLVRISSDGPTPSRIKIKKGICSEFKLNPEKTIIARISSKYGTKNWNVKVKEYKSETEMKTVEPKYIIERAVRAIKKLEEAKAKEAEVKETPVVEEAPAKPTKKETTEAPKEETTEEPKEGE